MIYIAGQKCPTPYCRGTILPDEGPHDPRLVCVLCGLQQDKYTGNPIPLPREKQGALVDKPVHRNGDYQPWRDREKDAWQREIAKEEH